MPEVHTAEHIRRGLDWHAEATAIVDRPNGTSRSFADLGARTRSLATALWAARPGTDERVATMLTNRAEFVEVDFATSLLGKTRVGLNQRLTAEEYAYILQDCGATTLVYDEPFRETVAEIREAVPVERFVSVDCRDDAATDYEDLIEGHPPTLPDVEPAPDDADYIMYTSGTTGRPKGAVLTQGARAAATRNHLADELAVDGSSAMLHVAPLTHGSGSKVLTFFLRGARNVILDGFTPESMLATIEAESITHSFVVPTIIKRLLAADGLETYDLSSLEQISYGGEPIPRDVLEEAVDRIGPVFAQVYGAAEVPHPVTVLPRSAHVDGEPRHRQSAGRPTTGVRVRLLEGGEPVERGEVGEIAVRGENVMDRYWDDPEATAEALRDGWFHTGDLGTMSEDGHLTIVGRKKEMIISGGLNVYPAQVEDTLERHPTVEEAAVVGEADETWGERVVAYVVPAEGETVTEADLVAFAKGHIAAYKVPKAVTAVSSLPRGSTGKVRKADLPDGPD